MLFYSNISFHVLVTGFVSRYLPALSWIHCSVMDDLLVSMRQRTIDWRILDTDDMRPLRPPLGLRQLRWLLGEGRSCP